MRSLTNRLRLSWLTVVALATFVVVALIRPDGVSDVSVHFATNANRFQQLLSRDGALRFETVSLLRAHLAADMVFLVAYGLLLRASIRFLRSVPLARFALHGPLVVMLADSAENVFTLSILRRIAEGDEHTTVPAWWFWGMNAAAATKWCVAGVVLLCLAVGWKRAATETRCRRWSAWFIAGGFALGGVVSLIITYAALMGLALIGAPLPLPGWLIACALVAPAAALLLQFHAIGRATLMLRLVNLARAPLLILLLMAAFGPIALGPAVAVFGGIMVAAGIKGVAVTTAAALAVLFACGTQINIVRAHAWVRVQDASLRVLRCPVLTPCVFWTGVGAAASLLFSVGLVSLSLTLWRIVVGIVIGAIGGLVLLFFIEVVSAYFSDRSGRRPPQQTVPFREIWPLDALLTAASNASPPAVKQYLTGSLIAGLFQDGSGYVETLPDQRRRILPGHTFATVQFVLTFVVFWFALYVKSLPGLPVFLAPTATSFLLLFLLSSWVLSAAAFFFDRYRAPLFTVVVAAALTTGTWSRTDYRVATAGDAAPYPLVTPGQVLHAFGDKPLVVAAAGGGIQAGAWTAQVLKGLDDWLHNTLRDRVALVSAVSGGAMGALYYGAFEDEDTLDGVVTQSLEASLDEVTTAFVRRDIFEVIGLRLGPDRGAALENSWEQRLGSRAKGSLTMRGWSESAGDRARGVGRKHPFPAFLFNGTVVESGQPIVFATTQFPTPWYRAHRTLATSTYPMLESANTILQLSVGHDQARDVGLKAVTAARLSAAFPYVSPAARLEGLDPYHIVDGGYYDFYGLVALSQWVDDALEELDRTNPADVPKTIGVVIARGLVSSDTSLREGDGAQPIEQKVVPLGWRWQLTAPPVTVLNARSFAQWTGGMETLKLLVEKWKGRGVTIVPVLFDYPGKERRAACQGAPLSWKLTRPQHDCIEKAWSTFTPAQFPEELRLPGESTR